MALECRSQDVIKEKEETGKIYRKYDQHFNSFVSVKKNLSASIGAKTEERC